MDIAEVNASLAAWTRPVSVVRAAAAMGYAHSMRAMIMHHPWIASVLSEVGLAYLGPNMTRLFERILALFTAAGFGLDEADLAANALTSYVIGVSTSEAAYLRMLARSGRKEQEWVADLWPAAEAAVAPHPRLRELYAAQRGADPERAREDNFRYGLEVILDGLAARLTSAAG